MFNLSVHKVISIFDEHVEYLRTKLPNIIYFDEFYKSRKSKYAFVMADFLNNKIINIFSSRHKDKLDSYLSKIPQSEQDNVDYIIIDMWNIYRDLSQLRFKNAKITVDSFHIIKHLNNAMIFIRIGIMSKYNKKN